MRANVKRISEMTGYSMSTVSNALNKKRGVSQETANQILEAARAIGYVEASGIRSVRYVTLDCDEHVIETIPQFSYILRGIEEEARHLEYNLTLDRIHLSDPDAVSKLSAILHDANTGVIVNALEAKPEMIRVLHEAEAPIVIIDGTDPLLDLDCVIFNAGGSVFNSLRFLREKGHTNIGYLKSREHCSWFSSAYKAYEYDMWKNGVNPDESNVLTVSVKMNECCEEVLKYLDSNPNLPTAFIADSDTIAAGAMRAFAQKGIRVPEDVSIIGFGDMNFSQLLSPQLTTVHLHTDTMGRLAMKRLHDICTEPRFVHVRQIIGTYIVDRDTVRDLNETN